MLGLVEHDCDLWMGAFQHRGDPLKLTINMPPIGLSEDRADDRGDHVLTPFRHDGEYVAHEMHPASSPAGTLEHGPVRFQVSSKRLVDDAQPRNFVLGTE